MLSPLPGLLTNFSPVGSRTQTSHRGCRWVRHFTGRVLLRESQAANLLLKFILAPAIFFLSHDRLIHSLYVHEAVNKTCDIISRSGNVCSIVSNKENSPKRQTCPLIPKIPEHELWSEDIDKRRQWPTLLGRPFDQERFQVLSVHLHHCPRVMIQHANPCSELWFEFGGFQNRHQNWWSNYS